MAAEVRSLYRPLFIFVKRWFLFVLFFLLLFSCFEQIDLTTRPKHLPHVCITTEENEEIIKEATAYWNKRLHKKTFQVSPNCDATDFFVPVSFVVDLPDSCTPGRLGCTITRFRNGRVSYKEVFLLDETPMWATSRHPYWTLVHEFGHVIGCEHSDLDYPCGVK